VLMNISCSPVATLRPGSLAGWEGGPIRVDGTRPANVTGSGRGRSFGQTLSHIAAGSRVY